MRAGITAVALLLVSARLTAAAEPSPPFQRTETREACANYTPTRQPFFGELHLHTQYSADAATLSTRNTPFDAYRFARGEKVGLPPFVDTRKIRPSDAQPPVGGVSAHPYCLPPDTCQYTATRVIQLPPGRALDFAAVTDHAEWLGEGNICFFEGMPCPADGDCGQGLTCDPLGNCVPEGFLSPNCVLARQSVDRLENGVVAVAFIAMVMTPTPQRLPFCAAKVDGTSTCAFQAKNVWQQIIAAAEQSYDRTAACRFTSFIGYEYTSMPTMSQCRQSARPCFADADCGAGDHCVQRGQCTQLFGKTCYVQDGTPSGCAAGGTCVADTGGNNLHRNIIFRNANVPALPISYIDVPTGCGAGQDCLQYTGTAIPALGFCHLRIVASKPLPPEYPKELRTIGDLDPEQHPSLDLSLEAYVIAAGEAERRWMKREEDQIDYGVVEWKAGWHFIRLMKRHPVLQTLTATQALKKVRAAVTAVSKRSPHYRTHPGWAFNQVIGEFLTTSLDEFDAIFIRHWKAIRYLPGESPIDAAVRLAERYPLSTIESKDGSLPQYRRLVSIAGWLQYTQRDQNIMLPTRLFAAALASSNGPRRRRGCPSFHKTTPIPGHWFGIVIPV